MYTSDWKFCCHSDLAASTYIHISGKDTENGVDSTHFSTLKSYVLLAQYVICLSVEAVQQLERKQQTPPPNSIPGRAREEQMPPKQMFKVRRSANDQTCRGVPGDPRWRPAPADRDDASAAISSFAALAVLYCQDGSIQTYVHVGWCRHSATAVPPRQKVKRGGEKVKPGAEGEHKRVIVGLGTRHVSLSRME